MVNVRSRVVHLGSVAKGPVGAGATSRWQISRTPVSRGTPWRQAERPLRILLVEDEESYRDALELGLSREGFVVELARDGVEGLRRFAADPPDLVLLDLVLPGMSGVEVCRRIAAMLPVPVIMVSALDSEADVLLGFELGAADYVKKPYRLRELVARIEAVLRRVSPAPAVSAAGASAHVRRGDVKEVGPVTMDLARREVRVQGRLVHLSRREFDLLAMLLSPPGQVRRREEILDQLWSGLDLAGTRTLDTHVRRLRIKLEDDPADPEYLVTVRGVGFRFDPEGRRHRLGRTASAVAEA